MMTDERELRLSALIDEDQEREFWHAAANEPELAAMGATVQRIRSARGFEPPSPGFAERGWERISRDTHEAAATVKRAGSAWKRRGWLTAAVSVAAAAVLLTGQWFSNPTASASEIHVTGTGVIADLGVKEASHPRYAGSLDRIGYGSEDRMMMWDRRGKQTEEWRPGFAYTKDAAWSPDGARAAFSGYPSAKRGPVSPSIWVAGTNGEDPAEAVKPADADTSYETPVWSPDGKRLAFTSVHAALSDETGVVYERTVYVMDADGSHLAQVAKGSGPAWSGDGKQLLYTVETASGLSEIRIAGTEGEQPRRLAEGESPAWSPSGPFIVYTKLRTEHRQLRTNEAGKETFAADVTYRELWALNAESGNESRLTYSEFPQKQIDGLLAESDRRGETAAVYTVSGVASDESPSWSPDGTRILFTRNSHEEKGPHYTLQELFVEYR